jgi:subtilase family serine protease
MMLSVACGLALAAGAVPSSLAAGPAQVRFGSLPQLPSGTSVLGSLAPSTRMQIAVALRPSDPAGLQSFAQAVSTPGSGVYRQYITPAQFADRFGATDAQVEAVEASLRARGLSPGPVTANHLSIPVTATVDQLQRAFSVSLLRVALPSGAHAIVNDVAPLLDSAVAGLVQGIEGLSTLSAPHPELGRRSAHASVSKVTRHVATGGPQPCAAATAAAPSQGAYTADQIASAYGFSGLYQAGDLAAGQTIAVYELEPYDPNDIASYQSCYGTSASLSNVAVDGGAGSGSGQGEAALDVEQVIGLAPRANVLVYEGPNSNSGSPGAGPYDTWNAIISQDRARVVTASWGQCEALEGPTDASDENTLFQEAAAQGQTIVSASGDEGSEDCNNPPLQLNGSLAVDDPSSQRFVTGVGGTTLAAIGPRPTEQVWNNGGDLLGLGQPGAGGGGVSSLWGMPSYQLNAASSLQVRQSTFRESPDVSADADPNTGYLVYWQGSWVGIGGTSGAAPLWAALVALANGSRTCSGSIVGFANPALYNAAGSAYAQDFNDIRSGSNDFTGTNGGRYGAGAGYDLASGLGTPNASSLVSGLCSHATHIGSPTVSGASLSGVRHDRPSLRFTVTSGANAPALRSVAIRLPSSLRFAGGRRRLLVTGPNGRAAGFTSSVSRGVLTIKLKSPKTRINVTVRYATLTATRREALAVKRGRAGKLKIVITVTDSRSQKARLTAMVKPRS